MKAGEIYTYKALHKYKSKYNGFEYQIIEVQTFRLIVKEINTSSVYPIDKGDFIEALNNGTYTLKT